LQSIIPAPLLFLNSLTMEAESVIYIPFENYLSN
jgi:hypothetical protein